MDKWLYHARFAKSRGVASDMVGAGHVRVNGDKAGKPAHKVGPGDVLTFAKAGRVHVVRIVAIGVRRGPAAEAKGLYDDLSAPPADPPARAPRYDNVHGDGGRPTKRDRRKIDAARRRVLD
nr:S4 domain-containing protein [Lutimaribacter sp. EGI FJ00013]